MEEGFKEYRKAAIVKAKQVAEDSVVETVNGPVPIKAGDYLCVSPFGDEWPCQRDLFEASYVPVSSDGILPQKAQIHDQGFKVPCSMVFCSNWTSLYIGVKDCHGEHRINVCESCLENILRSGKNLRPDLFETIVVELVDEAPKDEPPLPAPTAPPKRSSPPKKKRQPPPRKGGKKR